MIGDMPDDVRAARAAGVIPLAVVAPGDQEQLLADGLLRAGAGRVLQSLAELEEVLL
jgi:phosphoglycolate phosphatase-like HAD superfamily hydrolase